MSVVLDCVGLDAGYLGRPVVRDLSMCLEEGTVTTLLGPNGAGKTTVLATLAGLVRSLRGEILLDGISMVGHAAPKIARAGLLLVPDDRSLFNGLDVDEHLVLAQRKGGMGLDDVLQYFPALVKRRNVRAGSLSGGEQQMLALARGIIRQPKVLMIDEMSMGLAPTIIEALVDVLRRISRDLHTAVLIVEQHIRVALELADNALVLVHGDTVFAGSSERANRLIPEIQEAYLGVRSPLLTVTPMRAPHA